MHKTISMAYGHQSVPLTYDADRFEVLTAPSHSSGPLTDIEINRSLDEPIGSPHLDDLLSADDSVLIVVSDATRATACGYIVNLLVRRLIAAGISPPSINIIFATGIHRKVTPAEKSELLTPFIAQRIKTIDHDPGDESQMIRPGETRRGTRIELNRALRDFTHVILTGGVTFHYFAGFTGGRKSICPGLASRETIRSTHMLALDLEKLSRLEGAGPGKLDGNAVSEECEEIADVIAPSFLVNTIVDEAGKPVKVFAGNWRTAHRAACDYYLSNNSVSIQERRDVVVAGCGGYPYDINLIQAHKALDMAASACKDGGTIILMGECADGLGRSDFMKWFTSGSSADLARRLVTGYEVNGQTAWALLSKTERCRVRLWSSLPDDDVRRMNMIPLKNISEAIELMNGSARGFILPRASSVLPVLLPPL